MRILFLVYHGLSEHSGISKKILAQVEGLRSCGNQVHVCTYDYDQNGQKCRFIDGKIVERYGKGALASLKGNFSFGSVVDFIKQNSIDFVYIRSFHNANPWTIKFLSTLKAIGVKVVIEIPTFPYDNEYADKPLKTRIKFWIDKLFRNTLSSKCDAIVTFSDEKEIFGKRTICISNGIDFDAIKIRKPSEHKGINLLAVAEVHYWHGYDRLLKGLGEYYRNGGKEDVHVDIVGGIADTEMLGSKFAEGFKTIIDRYDISSRVTFHGQLFGEKLDECFDRADFAIGSLARHRSNVTNIKTLKNREYAARGIAFCYSEIDSDFEDRPYIIKYPANDDAIDISQIIDFIKNGNVDSRAIRESIHDLSWKNQMQFVLNNSMIIR